MTCREVTPLGAQPRHPLPVGHSWHLGCRSCLHLTFFQSVLGWFPARASADAILHWGCWEPALGDLCGQGAERGRPRSTPAQGSCRGKAGRGPGRQGRVRRVDPGGPGMVRRGCVPGRGRPARGPEGESRRRRRAQGSGVSWEGGAATAGCMGQKRRRAPWGHSQVEEQHLPLGVEMGRNGPEPRPGSETPAPSPGEGYVPEGNPSPLDAPGALRPPRPLPRALLPLRRGVGGARSHVDSKSRLSS